jgi:hypothetical protein
MYIESQELVLIPPGLLDLVRVNISDTLFITTGRSHSPGNISLSSRIGLRTGYSPRLATAYTSYRSSTLAAPLSLSSRSQPRFH